MPLLFKFADQNHRHPYPNEEYKEQPLGKRFIYFKEFLKDKNDPRYIRMSENEHIKKALDLFFQNQEKKKTEVKLTYEQKLQILIDECRRIGEVVKNRYEIEHSVYGNVKIGGFFYYHLYRMKTKENKTYKDFAVVPCIKKYMDYYLSLLLDKS